MLVWGDCCHVHVINSLLPQMLPQHPVTTPCSHVRSPGEFGACVLSYEMAVKTASAALLLLENCTMSPQSTTYLHATQEHMLECLASRGAAHFRQRLYDGCVCLEHTDWCCDGLYIMHGDHHTIRMQCDLDAAHALEEALQRRPDIQARLKHLCSPGNVRPYVMRMDGRGPPPPPPRSMQSQLRAAFDGAARGFGDVSSDEDADDESNAADGTRMFGTCLSTCAIFLSETLCVPLVHGTLSSALP